MKFHSCLRTLESDEIMHILSVRERSFDPETEMTHYHWS